METQTPVTQTATATETVATETEQVTAQAPAGEGEGEVAVQAVVAAESDPEKQDTAVVTPATVLVGVLLVGLVAVVVSRLRKK